MIQIAVAWRCRHIPDQSRRLISAAERALRELRYRDGELSIAIVSAREMARLHRLHCGVKGATDVITFPLGNCDPPQVDGEIVLCADVARRCAGRAGITNELILYLVHGLLHLAGHVDGNAAGFRLMHRHEDRILKRLDLPPANVDREESKVASSNIRRRPSTRKNHP